MSDRVRRTAILCALFALVVTLADRVWVRLGVLVYPGADRGEQAWWVPLLFAGLAGFAVHAAAFVTRRALPPAPATGARAQPALHATISAALFLAAHLAGGLFDDHAATVALVLAGAWLLHLVALRPAGREALVLVALAVALAAAGTFGEAALGALDLMRYPRPDVLGLPSWIPALWPHAAFLARDLGRAWFAGR